MCIAAEPRESRRLHGVSAVSCSHLGSSHRSGPRRLCESADLLPALHGRDTSRSQRYPRVHLPAGHGTGFWTFGRLVYNALVDFVSVTATSGGVRHLRRRSLRAISPTDFLRRSVPPAPWFGCCGSDVAGSRRFGAAAFGKRFG